MQKICFIVDSIFSIGGVQRVTSVVAKELAKDHDVTIVTFDKQDTSKTSLYDLDHTSIKFVFYPYPKVNSIKDKIHKAYSYLYKRYLPQCKATSDLYAYTSFPFEMRRSLVNVLKQGNYDTIIAVHAPLASRLATLRPSLPPASLQKALRAQRPSSPLP